MPGLERLPRLERLPGGGAADAAGIRPFPPPRRKCSSDPPRARRRGKMAQEAGDMEDGQLSDSDSDMTVTPSDTPLQVLVSVKGERVILSPARGAGAAGGRSGGGGSRGLCISRRGGSPEACGLLEAGVRRAFLRLPCATLPTPAPLGQILPNM